eukprot:TRINITY_DN23844_c0_g1_i1.p1 TRINITY_DN23844_c0_g1~~TRINITY_DN23844_c0_g1_i1.p1  ORF type:complete len:258 (-),score=153.43 TRINITY_DN23844_c0_g1_i1:609-1382(-)
MSNIHGLGSVSSGNNKNPKQKNEFFTSQGHQSGTGVLRPTERDAMGNLISAARANSGAGAPGATANNIGVITVYANGFIIGDGEFRDSSEAENKAFVDDLLAGEVPRELEKEVKKQFGNTVSSVGVQLVDKSKETYVPPKPKFSFANSKGQSLGGGGAGSASGAVSAGFAGATAKERVLDPNAKACTIQLVLANRQRVKAQFNPSHTVLDIYRHVMFLSKHPGPFRLMSGFPPRPLKDPSLTVEAGKLSGTSIQQRT